MLHNFFFNIWVLCIPFGGTFSRSYDFPGPDKLLIPILFLLYFFKKNVIDRKRLLGIITYLFLMGAYIICESISFFSSEELLSLFIKDRLVAFSFFFIPILYTSTMKELNRSFVLVIIVAAVGCLSAFLVSTGMLTLPSERFEASRIGIDFLPKAIGFLGSYGDLAIVTSLSVLIALAMPKGGGSPYFQRGIQFLVLPIVFLGILGTQSRNIVLTILIVYIVYHFFSFAFKKKKRRLATTILCISAALMIFMPLIAIKIVDLFNFLVQIGGQNAEHTVSGRLQQYMFAWEIFSKFPLFGASINCFEKYQSSIDYIHNMPLKILAKGGLLQLLAFALLLGRIFFESLRNAIKYYDSIEMRILLAQFFGISLSMLFYVGDTPIFWFVLGVVSSSTCIPQAEIERSIYESKRNYRLETYIECQ